MRIGILGGTFDPPHLGHLAIAEAAIEALELDEVIILPANTNPFKQGRKALDPKHRLKMVEMLCKENPKLAFSDMEVTRGGVSYTVDTLGELQMVHPGDYWFIMGADALKGFGEWKNPQRILRLCRLAVAARAPLYADELARLVPEDFQSSLDFIEMKPNDISATNIRERIIKGQPFEKLTTSSIVDYIKKNKLYK